MKIDNKISYVTSGKLYYNTHSGDLFEFEGCFYIKTDNEKLSTRLSDGKIKELKPNDQIFIREDLSVKP